MNRFAQRVLLLATIAIVCSAHIGSPDAWYSGPAGPYHVLVHVRAPAVVPGIAIINIKPDEATDRITAFVNKYDAVSGGPPPDVATPARGSPGWYRTELWVMDAGSNSVTVSLHGTKGEGTVVVPLVAVAARRLQFNGLLTAVLGAAALILVAGMLSVVGAAVRESVLEPGAQPDAVRAKRARVAMLRAIATITVVVGGLAFWWRAEDSLFAQNLFRPLEVAARTEFVEGTGTRLLFTIRDSAWTERKRARRSRPRGGNDVSNFVDDHGRLMHMFVISEDGHAHFAHLHPTTLDSVAFTSALPPLPAGRYRVFGDVLHASGFTQTLTTSVTLEAPRGATVFTPSDAEDSWLINAPGDTTSAAKLPDGAALRWLGGDRQPTVGAEAGLQFVVDAPTGDTARLEPYLGMLGHAAVVRDDGAVFIHLHPMGTISMSAQMMLSRKDGMAHQMPDVASRSDTLHFPYAFPQPGTYTVWVQVKRQGRIQTGAFRVTVAEKPS